MNNKNKTRLRQLTGFLLAVMAFFSSAFTRQTGSLNFNAFDVISAVNLLRASYGLPVLTINAALMAAAQSHSEYQASIRTSSHADAYGNIVTGRVIASGYGSGADIVAGENVAALTIGTENSVSIIVNEIWADPVHRGAMLNPKYTDIGVGVASDGSMVYITLNVAGINGGAATTPAAQAGAVGGGMNPPILPRVTSTPLADGTVYHLVGYGQTLGTIAGMYGVTVQQLVDRNNVDPDRIYAGQKLWIMKVNTPTTPPTELPSLTTIPTESLTATFTLEPDLTITPQHEPPAENNTRNLGMVIIFLIMGCFLLYMLIIWSKPSNSVHP